MVGVQLTLRHQTAEEGSVRTESGVATLAFLKGTFPEAATSPGDKMSSHCRLQSKL